MVEKSKEAKSERAFEKIIEAETHGELGQFESALGGIDVSEKIKSRVGEDAQPAVGGQQDDQPQKQVSGFGSFSRRVGLLLGGGPKDQKIKIPAKKVQQKKVVKALESEVKKLVKETQKMQNSRHYSPEKMEQSILRIRHLQKMISEVMTLATKTLEQWYRKLVVRKG